MNSSDVASHEKKLNIAVVGAGVAGLSSAWLLNRNHRVTVYEASDTIGGHANTVDVPIPEGLTPVDTGFIVYNELNYPNLTALFKHLGVSTKDAEMSFGASLELGGFDEAYFVTTFGIHFREDTDLGLRFLRNGHELPVVDQMSAKHPPKEQKDPWFLLNDARKYFLEPYFKIRNPEASFWIGSAFVKGRLGTYQLRGAISLLFVSLIPFLKLLWPVVPIVLLGLYILLSFLIFRGIKLRHNFWGYAPALLILYPLVHGFCYIAGFIFGPRKPILIKKVITEFKGE